MQEQKGIMVSPAVRDLTMFQESQTLYTIEYPSLLAFSFEVVSLTGYNTLILQNGDNEEFG